MTTRTRLSLFLLSAAALTFEINLTRLFSVAQFYHFAFMVVSLALLGFGASGTTLAIFPRLGRKEPESALGRLGLATGMSILGAYILTNWLPFDSFSIAVDRRQIGILILHYLALATPFFFSGMAVSLLLTTFPKEVGRTYAANMSGSALGCVIALAAPSYLGGEGTVVLSSGLAALAVLTNRMTHGERAKIPAGRIKPYHKGHAGHKLNPSILLPTTLLLLFSLIDLAIRLSGHASFPLLEIRLSPYKGLSYALQYPGAEVIYHRWNAFSRVDVVRSAGIHSLPGLSYRYLQPLPPQDGLLVDGDELSAVLPSNVETTFADYLPAAIAYHLRPQAEALILEPRGGLDITSAWALGARRVTAVEVNPLIVEAASPYQDARLYVAGESGRSYLRRANEGFDVILLSLATSYHPVRSGAYSLAEDYRYTVESFQDMLAHLNPGGLLVVTRWLQDPPSEDLRAFALAVTALESTGVDPNTRITAFRGYNTATLLVKNQPFTPGELQAIRTLAAERAFDLTYAPDIQPEETNRFNILPESLYYQTYTELLNARPRQTFYAAYPYDVRPPTDDHPFFGHFFKWSQAGQVLAELGKTWQPFGGAGYFVILILLILAILLAGVLILLPLALRRSVKGTRARPSAAILRPLLYFGLIGFAFLLVEIPLIQRFILYLGNPAYAMMAVIFSLLLFSAFGSRLSDKIPLRYALIGLAVLLLSVPLWLPRMFALSLGLSAASRLGLATLLLAPIGFLMGVPFAGGIRWLQTIHPLSEPEDEQKEIPWVWAVNGATSVVAAVLAALLALTFGFNWVLRAGALCYAGAWLTVAASAWRHRSPHP
jgi:hypothetical protein